MATVQADLINGPFRAGRAQTEFAWKLVDLYGSHHTDRASNLFMGGGFIAQGAPSRNICGFNSQTMVQEMELKDGTKGSQGS